MLFLAALASGEVGELALPTRLWLRIVFVLSTWPLSTGISRRRLCEVGVASEECLDFDVALILYEFFLFSLASPESLDLERCGFGVCLGGAPSEKTGGLVFVFGIVPVACWPSAVIGFAAGGAGMSLVSLASLAGWWGIC